MTAVTEMAFGRIAVNIAKLTQAHFLTGYVIQPGHTVVASTLPVTPPPNQTIRVWLTGYLPQPWVFWRTRATQARKPMIRPNVPHLAR